MYMVHLFTSTPVLSHAVSKTFEDEGRLAAQGLQNTIIPLYTNPNLWQHTKSGTTPSSVPCDSDFLIFAASIQGCNLARMF